MNEPPSKSPRSRSRDALTGGRVGTLVLAAITIAGIIVCVLLAAPFLGALTWALALAILFMPLHARIEAWLKRPGLAALVSVLTLALLVAVPAALLAERLVEEAAAGVTSIQARISAGEVQRLLDAHPRLAPVGKWIEEQIDLPSMLTTLASSLSNIGASFVRSSVLQVTEVVLTFYLLFYFLRDRQAAGRLLREWLPLTHAETERLFGRVFDTVHATIYGTAAVAAVQGTLGGLMFWVLACRRRSSGGWSWGSCRWCRYWAPSSSGYRRRSCSRSMAAGARLSFWRCWGALVVGGIDNVLRPMFVGNRLQLHTVPAFISMIGGLVLFGAPGFILGPLAVTVTILLVKIWRTRGQAGDPTHAG